MNDYCKQLEEQNKRIEQQILEVKERCKKLYEQYKWDHEVRHDPRKFLSPGVSYMEHDTCQI